LWDELEAVVHEFVHVDLTIVDWADFIIQHLPFQKTYGKSGLSNQPPNLLR
jgi:hypothetical protein